MVGQNRIEPTSVTYTVGRQTPQNDFGAVMARSVGAIVNTSAGFIGTVSTGAPGVSAAISGVQSVANGALSNPASSVGGAVVKGGTLELGATQSVLEQRNDPWSLLEAQQALQMNNQSYSVAYLQLQDEMQKESRQFNAVSNVMKVRHDSAKSAINNLR
jgi:hypothetical protein